jgi:hypothetical protein
MGNWLGRVRFGWRKPDKSSGEFPLPVNRDRNVIEERSLAMRSYMSWKFLRLAAAIWRVPLFMYGQDTATVVGTVTDPSGAAVPEARITLVNQATQFTRVVDTNAAGQFAAPSLPTGNYSVTVARAGFRRLTRPGLQLTAVSTVSVDLQLAVGGETQTVSVTDSAAWCRIRQQPCRAS